MGSDAFVRAQLLQSRTSHDALLLLFCCSPRCQYLLRMLPVCNRHPMQARMTEPLCPPLAATAFPTQPAPLSLHSAQRAAAAAYWASWAGCLSCTCFMLTLPKTLWHVCLRRSHWQGACMQRAVLWRSCKLRGGGHSCRASSPRHQPCAAPAVLCAAGSVKLRAPCWPTARKSCLEVFIRLAMLHSQSPLATTVLLARDQGFFGGEVVLWRGAPRGFAVRRSQHPSGRHELASRPSRRQAAEVVANGLSLCNGQQLAVDTTLVTPLSGQTFGSPSCLKARMRLSSGSALTLRRRITNQSSPK